MWRYILKRCLLIIPITLGVSFIVFSIMAVTPGDPATMILGNGGTQEEIDRINHELGYDKPFLVRYGDYLYKAIIRQDLGTSYQFKTSVWSNIKQRLPVSFRVTAFSLMVASMVGVPIGVLSAVKQYSLFDTIPTVMALFFAAIPTFWLGMMLMLLFCLKLPLFPATGVSAWKGYVLPSLSLGLPYAAQQLRFARSSMLETIRQDYIRTARAKGAPENIVIWKHALKNALMPIITIIGINFSLILGGAVATETLFSIPGLGSMVVTGIKMKDIPMVMGGIIVLSIICSLIMLIVDLLYALIDPRIRAKYSRRKRAAV